MSASQTQRPGRALPRVLGALLLAVAVAVALIQRDRLDAAALTDWLQQAGAAGLLIFIGLYVAATVLFLPGSVLTLTGGALFGPLWGTLYSLVGATTGAALSFLSGHAPGIPVVAGDAKTLPFADGAFDYVAVVTSLCFVPYLEQAVAELWRVTRRGVVLGLLHRRSLLYLTRSERGGHWGARWDMLRAVEGWTEGFPERPEIQARWAVFLPRGGPVSRLVEPAVPQPLPVGVSSPSPCAGAEARRVGETR